MKNWDADYFDDVFVNLKIKMKKTKLALAKWSRESFGDIFKQLIVREDILKIKEKLFEDVPNVANRSILNRAQAEYTKYLKFEEDF